MRIEELSIDRYGPLLGREPVKPEGLTLLHGPNERGKSLAIDALCRMLFRKVTDLKRFPGLNDRVESWPKGHVVLTGAGTRFVAPHDGTIEDFVGFSSRDLANVFVVRDNDLLVDAGFFSEATDRLTGFKKQRADAVAGELRRIGALTAGGRLSGAEEHGRVGERVEKSRQLRDRIERYLESSREQGYEALDEELVKAREQQARLERRREELERARKGERYRDGIEKLEELDWVDEKLGTLQSVSEETADAWRDSEREIAFVEQELERLRRERAELLSQEEGSGTELEQAEEAAAPLSTRLTRAQESVKLRMQEVDEQESRAEPLKRIAGGLRLALILAAVLAAAGIVAAVMTDSAPAAVAGYVALGLFVLLLLFQLYVLLLSARLSRAETRLRQAAADAGFEALNAKELRREIEGTEQEYERARQRMEHLRRSQANAATRREQIDEKQIPELEKRHAAAREQIEKYRSDSGIDTLEEYRRTLAERRELAERSRSLAASLRAALGTQEQSREREREAWDTALAELKPFAEGMPAGQGYDREEAQRVEQEYARLTQRLEGLQDQLSGVRQELAEIAGRARAVLPEGESFPCDTVSDLTAIRDRLAAFEESVQERARLASTAIELLQELQLEAEEELGALFGEESALSRYFSDITGGRYRCCELLRESGAQQPRIAVQTAAGEELYAEQLSGGTYDQLYLCVRLALAEELLGRDQGFMILDDPFVRADLERLERQLETLRTLVEKGWQILYFTAKQEVVDRVRAMDGATVESIERYWTIQ